MFLIVGLGNPGKEYEATRHNVGFMCVDALATEYKFETFKNKFDGELAQGEIADEKVYLLKPQTFMNLSGNSVVKVANFYKILPQNIIVIHDDIDLPMGKIKTKIGGSAGGHNGIKSIDAAITPNYNRIRIGIGRPQNEASDFVLSRFSKNDETILQEKILLICKTINILLQKGVNEYSSYLGQIK